MNKLRLRPSLFIHVVALTILVAACLPIKPEEQPVELANPASVYCVEEGGTLDIRAGDDGSQIGYCQFDDGSECEEWAFFRGECEPGGQ
jgi:putative hemolysin